MRSSIRLLAPDGGAGLIAGMDLSVAGAPGIIFAFALWGSGGVPVPLAGAAGRIRELRDAAGGRADAHPEFHDAAPGLAPILFT